MSQTNKVINAVAFHKKAVFEGDVEDAFCICAGAVNRQHNPLNEDDIERLRKFVASIPTNYPDAYGEIKRVYAEGDYVMRLSHWLGLSDSSRGEAVANVYRCEKGKSSSTGMSSSRSGRQLRTTTRCSDPPTTIVAAILEPAQRIDR